MFFDNEFSTKFSLKGKTLVVAVIGPENKQQISAGLHLMSAASIRQRFHGGKRDFTNLELDYLTTFDGINHYALGVLDEGNLDIGVAVIRMVRSKLESELAEVAITVIDAYQKQGLGSILLDLIILAAQERGIEKLSFSFLPDNDGIVRLISRKGKPIPGNSNKDSKEYLLDLTVMNLADIEARLLPLMSFK